MLKSALIVALSFSLFLVSTQALAYDEGSSRTSYSSGTNSKLKNFLTACAYGTAAGGLVGAASLAFSNDPTNNLQNITKGASLGLYAGVIYGAISSSMSDSSSSYSNSNPIPPQPDSTFVVTPAMDKGQVSGVQVGYYGASF